MTVRSIAFFTGRLTTSGAQTVYTVPAGFTLIFKSAIISNITGSTENAFVQIWDPATGAAPIIVQGALTSGQVLTANTYIVLPPYAQVLVNPGGVGLDVWLSGSLLQGTAS